MTPETVSPSQPIVGLARLAQGEPARSWVALAAMLMLFAASGVLGQTPPSFPTNILGQRQVTWNYTGLRPIPAAPAVGVHPRIFIGPDQRAEVCNRLTNTAAGLELFTNYVQRYTAIMRLGRSAGYDYLPSSIKTMPDGTARIGNIGFYDQSYYYTNLVAAQTNNIASMMTNGNGSVYARTLAGELALEALECWVYQNVATNQIRATNLAVAMDTWATYLLTRSDFNNSTDNWMLGGGAAFAEAYDFNYWAMNSNQCAHVRTALARIMYAAPYYGVGLEPEAVTSNWASLNTFQLIMLLAMEGETSVAIEGYDTAYYTSYFTNAMGAIYDFLTYGWHPTGEMYEGMGKGWFGGARQIAFAKRGYNFFGHPHLQNYVQNDWPACLQPFGYSWTHYDVLGGSGADNDRGQRYYTASDEIAMQWVYTNFPAAAFLWRNFATTAWCSNSVATGTNNYKAFLDFRDSKFVVSSSYGQDLMEAALFVQDPVTNINWNVQNATVLTNLDFVDTWGSTIVGRSDYSSNAVALQFHTRQDFGGHTHADRGAFSLSGLGRIWARFHSGPGSSPTTAVPDRYLIVGQASEDSSVILVDDRAMYVTPQEGDKMRIPAKLAAWNSQSNALFATCDATYAYTWAWKWNNFANTGSMTVDSGYQKETNSFNSFRRSNNKIPESYGNTPFWQYPHWNNPGQLEGIERTNYNTMQQVLRTAGLVRGARPYALIVDDIRKDSASHTYKWQMQIPGDLTLATNSALPAGFNAATDVLLKEPSTNGQRSLLVRILSPTNWTAGIDAPTNDYWRLTIQNTSVQPDFKIMLYPFNAGDPIPTNTWTATNVFAVALAGQTDTFTFYPRSMPTTDGRTVTVSEFLLKRGTNTVSDYRNVIEPFGTVLLPTATPTGLMAQADNNNQVLLRWNAATNATAYNLKRGKASGTYTTTLSGLTGTTYLDTAVTNGTTYYYVVSAISGLNESTNSAEVSATPGTVAHGAANLIWQGDGQANVWDQQNLGSLVWLNNGTNVTFWDGDFVTFDSSGSTAPAVNLAQALSPAGVVEVNGSNNYAFTGPGKITGGCSLQKDGPGTLTVSTTNDFTGGTRLNAGTISLTTPGALGTNLIDFGTNATLQWNGITTDLSSRIKIEDGATAVVDLMGVSVTFASPFTLGASGTGALIKTNSGALTLAATNAYTGGTTINGGYVIATNERSFGATSGPLTFNGGGLKTGGADLTLTRTVTLGTGGGTFQPASSRKIIFNGKVTGPGALTVCWDADAVWLSSALNDYAGNTVIGATPFSGGWTSGILRLGVDNVIPYGAGKGNVVLTQGSGTTQSILDLNGHNAQINGLVSGPNTNAIVDNRSGTGTCTLTVGNNNVSSAFGGVITDTSGTINLIKTGSGTLTLSGSNTYSGATLINAGALALSASGSIAASPLIAIGAGAAINVSGLANTFVLASGQTLSNSTSGTGFLVGNVNTGSGTNSVSYTSGTPAFQVTNGTLTLAASTVFRINNAGSALNPGSYKIIASTNGTVTGVAPVVSVTGGAIAPGASASLQIAGGELYLAVSTVPTTTALVLSAGSNPSTNGNALTFTATVKTNSSIAAGASGSYVFRVDGTAVATNLVAGGQASFGTSTLAVGTHAIVAEYSGDSYYGPSTNFLSQTVSAPPPVAAFTASPTNGAAPLAVTFTDTSIGSITNRAWSFGDGSSTNTTLTILAHTYALLGTNWVTLTVSGPGGTNAATRMIVVTGPATPPYFTAIEVSGQNVILRGTNGTAGATYLVLQSPDAAAPLSTWLPTQTNQFGPDGGFQFTNLVSPAPTQGFFMLKLP